MRNSSSAVEAHRIPHTRPTNATLISPGSASATKHGGAARSSRVGEAKSSQPLKAARKLRARRRTMARPPAATKTRNAPAFFPPLPLSPPLPSHLRAPSSFPSHALKKDTPKEAGGAQEARLP